MRTSAAAFCGGAFSLRFTESWLKPALVLDIMIKNHDMLSSIPKKTKYREVKGCA